MVLRAALKLSRNNCIVTLPGCFIIYTVQSFICNSPVFCSTSHKYVFTRKQQAAVLLQKAPFMTRQPINQDSKGPKLGWSVSHRGSGLTVLPRLPAITLIFPEHFTAKRSVSCAIASEEQKLSCSRGPQTAAGFTYMQH